MFAFIGKDSGKKTANNETFVGETAIAAAINCVNAGNKDATVDMIYNINEGICIGHQTDITFNEVNNTHVLLKEASVEGTPFYDTTNSVPINNGPCKGLFLQRWR